MEERPKRPPPKPNTGVPRAAGKAKPRSSPPRNRQNVHAPARPHRDPERRLGEAEESLRAIQSGEVDALVVSTPKGERVFTLAGAERPYRLLIEAMGEGALTLSRDGTVLYANQAFARIVGLPLEQVLGANLARFLPPEKGPGLGALLAKDALESQREEAVLLTETGVEVPVLLAASSLPESDPPQACVVVTDLTEAKFRQTALSRLYEALQVRGHMLDLADDAIVIRDAGNRIIYWNKGAEKLYGFTPEEAKGQVIQDLLRTEFPEPLPRIKEILLREGHWGGELLQRCKDGERTVVSTRWTLWQDERGDLSAVLEINTDITARKQANEALRETTRTLEELVQASPVGITVLDPEGKVLLWNPAMETIYGWTEEEVRGKPVPTAGQEGAKESLERVLAGERLAGVELRRVRKDGRPVDLLLWTAPIREESGRLRSTIAIVLDITHLKEVERIALTQQKLASLGQVAAGIAHEIRNPLSGINLYLHSLETFLGEWEIPNPEIRETTETVIAGMKAASVKMEATIQRVLSFSRSGPPRMEPLDVNICIREAVDLARISLQKAGAQVAVALREDLPPCRGDIGLLEQALINLMTNAAQALEKQEGQRLIEISSSRVGCTSGKGYHVTVSVADSGPGIPEDVRERIFEPFFTTKKLGTGIGLSITHKIITDHGGFIQVGTSRFGGALFTIGLPAGDKGEIPAA